VATHTCGSDMRHDGAPPSAIFAGVSTSRSMAASLDGTRLYADDLSFHRIGADRRKRQRNATQRKQQEEEVSLGIWESGRRDRSGGKCLDTRLGDVLIAVVAWRG
jgi:hypothetical protein